MTKEKGPEVVQVLTSESRVELVISDSFYEDVKRDLKFDPKALKASDEAFEASLTKPIVELQKVTQSILHPPKISQRGPRPKPKEVSE